MKGKEALSILQGLDIPLVGKTSDIYDYNLLKLRKIILDNTIETLDKFETTVPLPELKRKRDSLQKEIESKETDFDERKERGELGEDEYGLIVPFIPSYNKDEVQEKMDDVFSYLIDAAHNHAISDKFLAQYNALSKDKYGDVLKQMYLENIKFAINQANENAKNDMYTAFFVEEDNGKYIVKDADDKIVAEYDNYQDAKDNVDKRNAEYKKELEEAEKKREEEQQKQKEEEKKQKVPIVTGKQIGRAHV